MGSQGFRHGKSAASANRSYVRLVVISAATDANRYDGHDQSILQMAREEPVIRPLGLEGHELKAEEPAVDSNDAATSASRMLLVWGKSHLYSYPLSEVDSVRIGRHASSEILLLDPSIRADTHGSMPARPWR